MNFQPWRNANLSSQRRTTKSSKLRADQAAATLKRLSGQTDASGFDALDMVIEAATENVDLKQKIFAELEAKTRPDCILATNTSTIDIDVVGRQTKSPERILGTHFFSPAQIMKLVEVVRTGATSKQVLVDTLALVKRTKKTGVTVGNCTGFLVNRVFMPYGQSAGFLIDHGVHPYRIDKALFAYGMPMGPCRMGDLAGLDVSVYAGKIMDDAYASRAYRSALRALLVEAGRLGEKSGKGHYRYESGKAVEDPELDDFVRRAREAAKNPPSFQPSDEDIVQMLLFGVVNESCRALEEGVVIRAAEKMPRVTIDLVPPEVEREGVDAFESIGTETREVLERRPASCVVVRIVRKVRVQSALCRRADHSAHRHAAGIADRPVGSRARSTTSSHGLTLRFPLSAPELAQKPRLELAPASWKAKRSSSRKLSRSSLGTSSRRVVLDSPPG